MNRFLIVGLGNIGAEYVKTRHNIGFEVLDAFARRHDGSWRLDRLAEVATVKIKGRTLILIKPTTYMNLSGRAFRYWLEKEKIPVEHTLTIVDDIALPLDRIRIRPAGSSAGHNGLKDIEAALGSDAYPKLRFGIGNDFPKGRQVDFVLGRWTEAEWPKVERKIDLCCDVVEAFVLTGLQECMNRFNAWKLPDNLPGSKA